jgi:hypothetical protein
MADQDPRRDPKSHDPAADSETAWHGRDLFPAPPAGGSRPSTPLDVESAPRAAPSRTGRA